MIVQRFSFGGHAPDRDSRGGYVRYIDYERLLEAVRNILDDASACTTACHSVVRDALLDEARRVADSSAEND